MSGDKSDFLQITGGGKEIELSDKISQEVSEEISHD